MDSDLRSRRLAAGLSQQAMAVAAECSIQMVRQLESGYRPVGESAVLGRIEAVLARHEADGPTVAVDADDSASATGAAA